MNAEPSSLDAGLHASSGPGASPASTLLLQGAARSFVDAVGGLGAMLASGATPADETHKAYRLGTHRTVAPSDTLARVGPLMAQMGITRIANISGLDRLGIPVVMVLPTELALDRRLPGQGPGPGRRQGLGVDGVGRDRSTPSTITPPAKAGELPRPLLHPSAGRRGGAPADARQPFQRRGACRAVGRGARSDQAGRSGCRMRCSTLDFTSPLDRAHGSFLVNSNGLASGNHMLEAVSHAISRGH